MIKVARQLGLAPLALYALYKAGLVSGYYRWAERKPAPSGSRFTGRLFSLPEREGLAQTLGEDGRRALLEQAGEIVAGKWRMFGGEPVELDLSCDQPLAHWTRYETGKASLAPFLTSHKDIKFTWEPARFGWAYTLGRAYHLTRDAAYAEAFWESFERFTGAHPAYLGPHWMNGQEVAIRLMALAWAAQVFGDAPGANEERRARLAQAIATHAARIPPTLVYARAQGNNHLVSEAAALYTAGIALGRRDWRALGWRWLNRALQRQVSGYGEYIQHSANYHRLMLQAALWVNAIQDTGWPLATLRALGRATHWLFSMLDPISGRVPNLGANDGALLLPLSATPFEDYRPTVQAAARAFLRYQMPGGAWDELSLWLGLGAREKSYESNLYLADQPRGRDSWAYLRATSFRSRLGHIDQLHLDLWWRGLNIAQDAGTYLYNAGPPWDNPLVAGRVHNLVTVDGRDPMTRGGRFMTLDWFPAYSSLQAPADPSALACMQAYHNGYPGIRHERSVSALAGERWLVEDRLLAKQPHTYRLHWLLPDWEWQATPGEQGIELQLNSPYGRLRLVVRAGSPSSDMGWSLIRAGALLGGAGQPLPFEGWVSPRYGVKIPALSLAYQVFAPRGATFSSQFIFPASQ